MAHPPPSDTIWVGNLPAGQDEGTLRTLFEAYGVVTRTKALGDSNGKGAAIIQLSSVEDATWLVENLNGNIAQGLVEPIVVRFVKPNGGGAAARAAATTQAAAAGLAAGAFGASNGGYAALPGLAAGGAGAQMGAMGMAGMGMAGMGMAMPGKHMPEGEMTQIVLGLQASGGLPEVPKEEMTQLSIAGLLPDTTDLDLYKMFTPFGCPIPPNGVKAMLKEDGTCTGMGFVDVMEPTTAEAAVQVLNNLQLPNGNRLRVQTKRLKQ